MGVEEHRDHFIHPDSIYGSIDSITFAYRTDINKLFIGDGDESHAFLVYDHPEYLSLDEYSREEGGKTILWGRLGVIHGLIVISFWNVDPVTSPVYRNLDKLITKLVPYIARLRRRYPECEVVVSTPYDGTFPVSEVGKKAPAKAGLVSKEEVNLLKRLHLLRGQEKKDALKRLGLGGEGWGSGHKHPWAASMRRSNLLVPGGKWWAPYSESLDWAAELLLEEDGEGEEGFRALLEGLEVPEIRWVAKGVRQWKAKFQIGDKEFVAVILCVYGGGWEIFFYQEGASEEGRKVLPLSLVELAQLGLALDSILQEFFDEVPEAEMVTIYPIAGSEGRRKTLGARRGDGDIASDVNKLNAYKFMFDKSELKRRGFRMTQEGDELVISRPGSGSFEKEVDRFSSQLSLRGV